MNSTVLYLHLPSSLLCDPQPLVFSHISVSQSISLGKWQEGQQHMRFSSNMRVHVRVNVTECLRETVSSFFVFCLSLSTTAHFNFCRCVSGCGNVGMFWGLNVLVFFRCGCVGMFWGMGVFGIFQVWVFWYISGCVCWYVSRCGCVGMFQVWRCWFVSGCGCVGMFQDVGVLVCFRAVSYTHLTLPTRRTV